MRVEISSKASGYFSLKYFLTSLSNENPGSETFTLYTPSSRTISPPAGYSKKNSFRISFFLSSTAFASFIICSAETILSVSSSILRISIRSATRISPVCLISFASSVSFLIFYAVLYEKPVNAATVQNENLRLLLARGIMEKNTRRKHHESRL